MTISCEIIKDLLPLYHDGVCSSDSRSMIEDHLACCENCQAELNAMNGVLPINNIKHNLEEAEAVKKLSRKWKKGMLKSLLNGILVTLLMIAALALILYIFVGFKIV